MSRLDDDLARAVEDSEASAPVTVPKGGGSARRGRGSVALLAALLVMGAGGAALVLTSFEGAAIYSKGVDELLAEREKLASRKVRVEGNLVKGTLQRRDEPCEYRFDIEKNGASLPVRYAQCVVPDTFRDVPGMDVAVTAEGKIATGGWFEASHIMAKCPSKYEMKQLEAAGQKAPHGAVSPGAPPVALD